MKLKILREVLLEKLALASRFTSSKFSSIASLQGILLIGGKGKIEVYSTNLSSFFHTTIKIKEDLSFRAVVEPKKTIEILNLLQAGEVELEINEKQISINQGKNKTTLSLVSYEDFPTPPEIKEKKSKIEAELLLKELPMVTFAASSDETRPVLTGINFLSQDDQLMMVATDGFRLSLLKTKKDTNIPSMLVPKDFLIEVARFIGEEKEVSFGFSNSEKVVLFELGENQFFSRLIEGEFPDFERVLPADKKTKAVVDREEFLRNVKLASVIARDFSNIVICEFGKEGVYVRPKTDTGETNETFQEAEFEGEEQKIAFNFRFLIDFLNNVSSKKITVEILRPDAPVIFKIEGKKDFLHVVMPIRIQQ